MGGLKQLRALWWAFFGGPVLAIIGWLVSFFSSHPVTLAAGPFGLAVIVVAVSVRLLLLALLPYQLAAGQKAREAAAANDARLAPELARLRKRLGKDPAALSRATYELYRRHGINPLAPALGAIRTSLLPMLIQLPIIAAVYTVIRAYVASPLAGHDMHFLWIPSLAGTDPLYLLPILVGISTYVLFRLTAGRTRQIGAPDASAPPGAMGIIYPMAIAVTTQFVPAALAVYWIAGNLVAIVQQHLVNIRFS
jgi:YidC/Oxa1 family membrane protein insertase